MICIITLAHMNPVLHVAVVPQECLKVTPLYRHCLWGLGKVPNPQHFIKLSVLFQIHWPLKEHVALQIWSDHNDQALHSVRLPLFS